MTKDEVKKKNILLVEDDEFLLRSYKTKFKKFGIEADVAYNGKEGESSEARSHPARHRHAYPGWL